MQASCELPRRVCNRMRIEGQHSKRFALQCSARGCLSGRMVAGFDWIRSYFLMRYETVIIDVLSL